MKLTLIIAILLVASCSSDTKVDANKNVAPSKVYSWQLAETWNANFPIIGEGTKKFAKTVAAMSGGRLSIRIDSANKHKAPLGIFDLVRTGQYQMGHSSSYYWKGIDFNSLFFTTVPFGMTTSEQYAWFYHGGGIELMREVYAKYGINSYLGGNTGNQMGGWFRKKITSVADLKGLKMRIPGFAGEVLAKLGASPVNIAAGELYTALERNTIDALEWIGPSLDLRMGFPKIAKYYYSGWHEPGAELQFMVNQQAFNKLPEDLQHILESAIKLTAFEMYVHFTHESAKNLAVIKQQYPDVELLTFPDSVMQALYKANNELLQEVSSKNELTKRIVTSQQQYLQKARKWTNFSDRNYLDSVKK